VETSITQGLVLVERQSDILNDATLQLRPKQRAVSCLSDLVSLPQGPLTDWRATTAGTCADTGVISAMADSISVSTSHVQHPFSRRRRNSRRLSSGITPGGQNFRNGSGRNYGNPQAMSDLVAARHPEYPITGSAKWPV
jgi:hypothetical protein